MLSGSLAKSHLNNTPEKQGEPKAVLGRCVRYFGLRPQHDTIVIMVIALIHHNSTFFVTTQPS